MSRNHWATAIFVRSHRAIEAAILVGAFICATFLAFLLRFEFHIPAIFFTYLNYALVTIALVRTVTFITLGLHRSWWGHVSIQDLLRLAIACLSGSAGSIVILRLIGPAGFPRSIFVLDFLICFGLTAAIRVTARLFFEARRRKASRPATNRAIIYGAGDAGIMLAREIRQNLAMPYELCGFVDDDQKKRGSWIQGLRVLGDGTDLQRVSQSLQIQTVLIAIPSVTGTQMTTILKHCSLARVNYKTMPPLGDVIESHGLLNQIRDVAVEDLLGRKPVRLNTDQIRDKLEGRVVLVSGAAGSIGSELCRQIARFSPSVLVAFDAAETPLFYLEKDMRAAFPGVSFRPEIGSIQNRSRLNDVFGRYQPAMVFHAAAYKHVPMMESCPFEAVENNVFGTSVIASCAAEHGVKDFVMISSDKAVHPTNIMGATKRIAELVIRSMQARGTNFVSVRFGNVLGSNGSVVPIFKSQIAAGGPVTITHPDMKRYFMTIPEASQLVLQASTLGAGGEIFVLDMGDPVKISDLATNLILLSGLQPGKDVQIQYTGIRPGEKLYEELQLENEETVATTHEKIKVFSGQALGRAEMDAVVQQLQSACGSHDLGGLVLALKSAVPDYNPSSEILSSAIGDRTGSNPAVAQPTNASRATLPSGALPQGGAGPEFGLAG
ncbi:nucleoside-diphosphate sugar epimerase/dehydratase [uncultured Paludibaculum sp.]|uniref:polysaccharide biosynthesis protein n=1 Tax=uncultured Paludibaculum sp. TaxID=1765020 RepID=UPI002AAB2761|nr:nucleoside-diphosphate sugar epimerase/dehydratase [uncultured Paludibaculum sp.]